MAQSTWHVSQRILASAEILFAENSYSKTTIANIARDANIATGNVYRYFSTKKAIFDAVITTEFVKELERLTHQRVEVLNQTSEWSEVSSMEEAAAGRLLAFWIANRKKMVILLSGSMGTEYENYQQNYIDSMYEQSIKNLPNFRPDIADNEIFRFTFRKQLSDTVSGIALILKTFESEKSIIEAFSSSWAYQAAGIQSLIEWHTTDRKE